MQSIDQLITQNELFLVPLYMLLIFIISSIISTSYIKKYIEYKYFNYGLLFKLLGVTGFCIIYLFYYEGGDTVNYFKGTQAIANLIEQDFEKGLAVLFNTDSYFNSWQSFNAGTLGFPPWLYVERPIHIFSFETTVPFYFLGLKSFLITSFLTACFSFIGIWKLYRLFNTLYPGNKSFCLFNSFFTNFNFLGWRYHER